MNSVEIKFSFMIQLIVYPFTLLAVMVLLGVRFGYTCFIAVAIYGLIYIVHFCLSSISVRFYIKRNIFSDQRIKFISEVIEGKKYYDFYI